MTSITNAPDVTYSEGVLPWIQSLKSKLLLAASFKKAGSTHTLQEFASPRIGSSHGIVSVASPLSLEANNVKHS
jgi:hypothetical protein